MIKNYFIITLRNFIRNSNYTLINVIGLSVGVTSCIIIFLLITYDLSFDKFHSKYDHIYRIVQDDKSASGISHKSETPYPIAKAFRNDFPEIPLVTQVHSEDESLVRIGEEKHIVENVLFVDSLFFEVFDFKVISGNPHVDLGQPGKVFLTKSLADKLLKGEENATLKLENRVELEVAGIVADPPPNSHINFSMVVAMSSFTGDFIGGFSLDHWGMTASAYTYIVLPDQVPAGSVNKRFPDFIKKYHSQEDVQRKSYALQPLHAVHFGSEYTGNPGSNTNVEISDLAVMGVLGIFILAIACINFINLATALAIKKSKEIGIRKTLGAKRGQLTAYFLGETFLLTVFSVLLSLCATEWLLSWLNGFLDKQIALNLFSNPSLIFFMLCLIVFATLLSGFYPALILSGFNPAEVLKNKITARGTSGAAVRKVLVVFQFLIAQVLIIGTLIVAGQMEYFKNKPLGFEKEALINVVIPEIKQESIASLRNRLVSNANISQISFSIGAPTSDNSFGTNFFLTERGPAELHTIDVKPVDRHYLSTYGITLKAGRWFEERDEKLADMSIPEDQQKHVYIINESAMKQLGFNDPGEVIGKHITTGVKGINAEVVGVVEDFHVASLHDEIEPVVLMNFPYFYYDMGVKLDTDNFQETISFIGKQWSEVYPDYYFEYEFLDQKLESLYRQDQRTFTLFKIFAGVSIFIGCLGLYGLISFMANQKLKEVGIRKVLGATVGNIVMLFSKEFIRLIIVAFLIAIPVSWYFMSQWLQGFAYRIDIHWSVYAIGIFSTLLIALLTVSYRSVRAAISNPAETLRTE